MATTVTTVTTAGSMHDLGQRTPQGLTPLATPDGVTNTAPGLVSLAGGGQPPGPVGQAIARLPDLRNLPHAGAAASQQHLLYGTFTMLKYIETYNAAQLERRVGYASGRLKPGFRIVALAPGEVITPDELVLDASSRWPEGNLLGEAQVDKAGASPMERVLEARGQPVDALKQKVLEFFRRERGNTPAKIIPVWKDEDGSLSYPPATAIDGSEAKIGVPQFRLRPAVSKAAVLIRSIE